MRYLMMIIAILMVPPLFADEVTIETEKDAIITSAFPYDNDGDWEYITANYGYYDTRALIEFPLDDYFDLQEGYYIVNEATFSVYHIYNDPTGRTWYLYKILEEWEEMSVTYNNKPEFEEEPFAEKVYGSEGWEEFDVTNMVQSWLDGECDNYGIQLWRGDYYSGITYHLAREHANDVPAKLYINYDDLTVIEETSIGTVKALYR